MTEPASRGRGRMLFVGPYNWAGQDRAWAEAVSRELGIPAKCFAGTTPQTRRGTGQPHVLVPHHRLRPYWIRGLWLAARLRSASHLLIDSLAPLRTGGSVMSPAEIDYWTGRSMHLAAVFHGSDIRNPELHIERIPHSHMRVLSAAAVAELQHTTTALREAAVASGLPLFVSTPDLLIDVPSARWLPLVVDPAIWRTDRPALATGRPRVLHLPSKRNPPVKGTVVVDAALRDLESRGAIEYVSPQSAIPHSEMPELVKSVDVVIDQVLIGSYGVAAVEAMAAGRLTIGYVASDVRDLMPAGPPILDAPPDRFADVMADIAAQPDAYRETAGLGPGFAATWHDGRVAATTLADFLLAGRPDSGGVA